jgi:hypothetical protein
LQELKTKEVNNNEHVIVTPPDRFYQDALTILLVDWPADLIDQAFSALQRSNSRLAIHIFDYNDHNYTWLLDVANQANIVAININNINHIDLLKGQLISKNKSFYFGRLDMNNIFTNHTDDPIGKLLVLVGENISQMEI